MYYVEVAGSLNFLSVLPLGSGRYKTAQLTFTPEMKAGPPPIFAVN